MKLTTAINVLEDYKKCPDCNNEKVGNGQGKLEIGEDYFARTCRCGFSILLVDVDLRAYESEEMRNESH